jgi:quercetin dioxygenase-like cupin family protein
MKIEDLDVRHPLPGTEARFVHSERMTIAYWRFEPGTDLPEHSHPHDQITNILEGEFALVIDGVSEVLRAGDVQVIPSNSIHSGHAITACRIIDVFSPVRDDFR